MAIIKVKCLSVIPVPKDGVVFPYNIRVSNSEDFIYFLDVDMVWLFDGVFVFQYGLIYCKSFNTPPNPS